MSFPSVKPRAGRIPLTALYRTTIGIGFADKAVALTRTPGWEPNSYGYHGDDGHFYASQNVGKHYGPTFTAGDVIGCGLNFRTSSIFYTKNGEHLGECMPRSPAPGFPPRSCSVVVESVSVFLSVSAHTLPDSGVASSEVKGPNLKLFPTVGLKKHGEHVRVNFGQTPFVFDVDGMMKACIFYFFSFGIIRF